MKKTIKEMIRLASQITQVGGLGNGEAEKAARPTTPDSGHRRVDTARAQETDQIDQDSERCRIIGYLPLSRAGSLTK